MEKNALGALAWLGPAFSSMIARPMQRAVRSPGGNILYVGTEAMGTMYRLADVNRSKKERTVREGP